MTLKDTYTDGKQRLEQAGVPEADLDAWYLLEYVTGISRAAFYADPDREVPKAQKEQYEDCLKKRIRRIPLQHITGEQEFMGLNFRVNEHVLIPRQDTETLVEQALDLLKAKAAPRAEGKYRFLDMCTGSGCILLSMLFHARYPATGIGADISEKALAVARDNADALGMKADFIQGDLFENIKGMFSMILSNPPYIPSAAIETLQEEVRLHDPREALDGKEDGLYFYRRIVKESREYLLAGGYLLLEIGHDQAEEVSGLMHQAGYSDVRVKKDLAGLDRVVHGRYIR